MKTRLIPALILLLASACALHAAVPLLINYQGVVMDSAGAAIGATTPVNRKIIFRIFDHPSSTATASRLWSEEHTVTILNGEFSILLGQGNPVSGETSLTLDEVFNGTTTDRFLEITVDNGDGNITTADQPISPRQQLTSVAYAMRAKMADTVASGQDVTFTNGSHVGLGWYGTGRLFNSVAVDGPVLYGNAGGALGSFNGTTQTTALSWNSAGNVGIGGAALTSGTTKFLVQGDDPGTGEGAQQLMIRGSTTPNKRLILGIDTTNNRGMIQAVNSGSTYLPLVLNQEGGNVIIASGTNGGNVGIGTTAPTSKLQVNGTVTATTFSGSGASLTTLNASNVSSGTLAEGLLPSSVALLSGSQTFSGSKTFSLAVGIGGGTAPAGTTTNRLYVTGDSTATAPDQLILRGFTDTDLRLDLGIKTDTATGGKRGSIQAHDIGTAYLPLILNPGGGRVGIGITAPSGVLDINVQNNTADHWDVRFVGVTGTGAIRMTENGFLDITNTAGSGANHDGLARLNNTGAWSAVSDRRLKHEIEPLGGLLEKALALKPVSYRFKTQTTKERHLGFIAQEVQKLLPSFVTEDEILTLNYAGLSTVAIGAIQEQHQIVKEQQEDIEKLAASNAALEERVKKLEARDKARDAKLAALERLLLSDQKPAARTASLKKAADGAE